MRPTAKQESAVAAEEHNLDLGGFTDHDLRPSVRLSKKKNTFKSLVAPEQKV